MNEAITAKGTPPSNYLVFAIFVTILCCQILGIVSIVYAAQVNAKWNAGDLEGAKEASKNAKIWAWISFAVGIGLAIFFTMLGILGVLAGMSFGGFNF